MKKLFLLVVFVPIMIFALKPYKDFLPEPALKFSPKSYICTKTDSPILIDGKMDEDVWQDAKWTDDFVDIEGDLKPKPEFQTRVKMLWDDKYFYFFCKMEEPNIWGKLKNRDDVVFFDNDFEIFIDPDGDTHNYFEFEMNALNTVWDLFLTAPYRDSSCKVLDSWDIQGLKTAVDINGTLNNPNDVDNFWCVEIAYPWKVLEEGAAQCPPKDGDQWRVNFSRVEWDTEVVDNDYVKLKSPEHNWVWSPQGLINMHFPERWGFVQFSDEIGKGNQKFVYNEEEDIKQVLRKLYYKQKTFYYQNKYYSADFGEIGFESNYDIKIEIIEDYYQAKLIYEGKSYFIRNDGLTWIK